MATAPRRSADALDITLNKPEQRYLIIRIKGTSPLLQNRMSDKVRAQLSELDPASKKRAKSVYDSPEERFRQSLHVIDAEAGRYGVPPTAIWKALVTGGGRYTPVPKTEWRGSFRIRRGLLEIKGSVPEMNSAIAQPYGKPPMPVYRGEFKEWHIDVPVLYDARLITSETLVNLFSRAGFSIGIGSWRPECDGDYGTFEVEDVQKTTAEGAGWKG